MIVLTSKSLMLVELVATCAASIVAVRLVKWMDYGQADAVLVGMLAMIVVDFAVTFMKRVSAYTKDDTV